AARRLGAEQSINGQDQLAGDALDDRAVYLQNPGKQLSSAALTRLLRRALRERFFALPARIGCPGTLPDFASMYVTVSTGTRTKRVLTHGECSARFQAGLPGLESAA